LPSMTTQTELPAREPLFPGIESVLQEFMCRRADTAAIETGEPATGLDRFLNFQISQTIDQLVFLVSEIGRLTRAIPKSASTAIRKANAALAMSGEDRLHPQRKRSFVSSGAPALAHYDHPRGRPIFGVHGTERRNLFPDNAATRHNPAERRCAP
jgi:hypothetical protein